MNYKNIFMTIKSIMLRLIVTLILLRVIIFIFSNSAQVGADQAIRSQGVTEIYQKIAEQVGFLPQLTNYQIRKLAHFTEYALEGFVALIWLDLFSRRYISHVSWPVLFCVLTAMADETLQLVVSGRQSQILDVWIDTAGALTGIALSILVLLVLRLIWYAVLNIISDVKERLEIKKLEAVK